MGYHIEYAAAQKKHTIFTNFLRLPALCLLCFALFLLLVVIFWPEGTALLQKTVFSLKGTVAAAGLDDLAEELHTGEPMVTAFADFCRKLLS